MKKLILPIILAVLVTAVVFASEFFPDIRVTGTSGPWMDARSYASLNACVAAVPALTPRTILISDPGIDVVGNLTIPSHVTLVFTQYGMLDNVGSEITFQNPNPIIAPNRRLHMGAGDLDFAVGTIVKTSWFDDFDQALTMLADDTVTLVITESETLGMNIAVPATVTLRWESPFTITHAGFDLTGLKKIEAGTYQIFGGGAGAIDFLAGSVVHSSWFSTLTACLTATDNENVALTILIDQPEDMDSDQAFDVFQNVKIIAGNTITITGGDTLTFGGTLDCPPFHAFLGNGTIGVGPNVRVIYPEWFGALGDGITDDSVAIQKAIDAVATREGGIVQFQDKEYVCNVTIKEDVTMQGHLWNHGYGRHAADYTNRTRLTAAGTGVVIDTPVARIYDISIMGFQIEGLGAAVPLIGIHFRDVVRGSIQYCGFDNLADQAILHTAGNACRFADITAVNCMLNRARTQHGGVIEIWAFDDYLARIESNPGLTLGVSDANLYIAAFAIIDPGSTAFITDCVGEFGDVGYYVSGALNHFNNCRADRNMAHGFMFDGAWSKRNVIVGCIAMYNSEDTTNTYDHFHSTATSAANLFIGCFGLSNPGIHGFETRYGFYDNSTGVLPDAWNTYTGCRSANDGTAWYFGALGNDANFPDDVFKGVVLATDGDTTPSVNKIKVLQIDNSAPTTITDFDDGLQGQVIYVFCSYPVASNTDIAHGGHTFIRTFTSDNMVMQPHNVYSFLYHNSTWQQISSSTWYPYQIHWRGADAVGATVRSTNANELGPNAGFYEISPSVFVPYWSDITP